MDVTELFKEPLNSYFDKYYYIKSYTAVFPVFSDYDGDADYYVTKEISTLENWYLTNKELFPVPNSLLFEFTSMSEDKIPFVFILKKYGYLLSEMTLVKLLEPYNNELQSRKYLGFILPLVQCEECFVT